MAKFSALLSVPKKSLVLEARNFYCCNSSIRKVPQSPDMRSAADCVGAGIDEWVLVTRGSAARIAPESEHRPIHALVVGIIDTVNVENRLIYSKKDDPYR